MQKALNLTTRGISLLLFPVFGLALGALLGKYQVNVADRVISCLSLAVAVCLLFAGTSLAVLASVRGAALPLICGAGFAILSGCYIPLSVLWLSGGREIPEILLGFSVFEFSLFALGVLLVSLHFLELLKRGV